MEMQMEGSYVFIVVVTGLVVVFLGLVLLILFVWLMGKIFGQINKAKDNKKKAAAPASEKTEVKAAAPAAPVVEDGISDEVVAVITAAVAAVMGTGCTVKSVKKAAAKTSRRTAWGAQGISESTRAF